MQGAAGAGDRVSSEDRWGHRYRACAAGMTAAILYVACGLDPAADLGRSRQALGEIPPDAFTDRVIATTGHPGFTPAAGSVTDDGAAVFTVPLDVPEGRNGMAPTLSLQYHSRTGDGFLGTGWTLAGLSSITRCARNQLIDGVTRNVRFDPGDAFCLDGDRLVEGEFWGGGQYRRWRDGLERIALEGGDPGDPGTVFRVSHPDGTIWSYGGTTDGYIAGSRVTIDPNTGLPSPLDQQTYAWLLTRVEDTHGNYIEFQYARTVHDDLTIEVLPTDIIYTGHTSLGPGQRRVMFEYEPRPPGSAQVVQWINRFGVRTTKRLSDIYMIAPATPIHARRYRLHHDVSPATSSARLHQIEECDGFEVCRPPLIFSYEEGEAAAYPDSAPPDAGTPARSRREHWSHVPRPRTAPGLSPTGTLGPSQFERQSTIMFTNSVPWVDPHWYVLRETTGIHPSYHHGIYHHGELWDRETVQGFQFEPTDLEYSWALIPFDYDRDGQSEFLRHRVVDGLSSIDLIRLNHSPGGWTSTSLATYGGSCYASHDAVLVADLTGSGVGDLIRGCGNNWSARLHDGPYGSYSWPATPLSLNASAAAPTVHAVDWDGDGRQELLYAADPTGTFVAHGLNEAGTAISFDTGLSADREPIFLDANGDGLPDVLTLEPFGVDGSGRPRTLPYIRLNIGGELGRV